MNVTFKVITSDICDVCDDPVTISIGDYLFNLIKSVLSYH